jgi:hypothetical protein
MQFAIWVWSLMCLCCIVGIPVFAILAGVEIRKFNSMNLESEAEFLSDLNDVLGFTNSEVFKTLEQQQKISDDLRVDLKPQRESKDIKNTFIRRAYGLTLIILAFLMYPIAFI